jgi:23S rRNA (adenine2503-C2)-methyltransferase
VEIKPNNPMLGMDRSELTALMEELGEPGYRSRQLLEAIYRQRVESPEQISTLPTPLRGKLAEMGFMIGLPQIEKRFVSQDGTVRYLMAFSDGQSVETVWMPEGDGGEAGDGSEAGEQAERFADGASADRRTVQGQNSGRSTICICCGLPVLSDGASGRKA